MPLTDTACKNAKGADKPFKLSDGGGLFLLVKPNGSKLWQQAYRYDGKHKLLSHGSYPTISLQDARARRDAVKALLADGTDPSEERKARKGIPMQRMIKSDADIEAMRQAGHVAIAMMDAVRDMIGADVRV